MANKRHFFISENIITQWEKQRVFEKCKPDEWKCCFFELKPFL
jgi:hypothetical protein